MLKLSVKPYVMMALNLRQKANCQNKMAQHFTFTPDKVFYLNGKKIEGEVSVQTIPAHSTADYIVRLKDFYPDYSASEVKRFAMSGNINDVEEIEHFQIDSDKEVSETVKESKKTSGSSDWELFTSMLGTSYKDLPDYYTIDEKVGYAVTKSEKTGEVTVFFATSDTEYNKAGEINMVVYRPLYNKSAISDDAVTEVVDMVSEEFGEPKTTTHDNTFGPYKHEGDLFKADWYSFHDGEKEVARVMAQRPYGKEVDDLSITFYQ